jgi:simple sugar transport system permease protein
MSGQFSTTSRTIVKIEPEPAPSYRKALIGFLTNNMVTILFVALSVVGLYISGMNSTLYINDIISRVSRNSFLVLALIIPVIAGMGLNFSIVLGAMAAQAAIIFVTHWGIGGLPGILLCAAIATPLSIILGYMTGKLFNRTKGQEMITGLIFGFFMAGVYWFIFLQLVGGIIPMDNEVLVLSSGVGIRTTVDLTDGLKYGLDHVYRLPLPIMMLVAGAIGALYHGNRFRLSVREKVEKNRLLLSLVFMLALVIGGMMLMTSESVIATIQIPVVTWLAIGGLCLFIYFFSKTKLGQDMRSVGQDRHVAAVSGIEVDKVRIIAVMMSMVLASWGHIIFLQNMGAFSTYGSHEQIGFYAVAAILIGGATVTKATTGQALLGVFLFHTLFIVAPATGREMFGDAQVGEFFRVFVAYGVIGITLAMYAWKRHLQSK